MSANAPRTRRRSMHIAAEVTPGVDPSADGSGYTFVPADPLPMSSDEKEPLETQYAYGRNYPSESEEGPDGASVSGIQTPLIGLASSPGDNVNASTVANDWLDILLLHALGAQQTTLGRTVSSSGNTSLTLASDVLNAQDLVPVFEVGIPAAGQRTQWAQVTVDPGDASYTVAPQWVSNPTSAALARGAKVYRDTDEGGATLAVCITDDTLVYTHLMGRCNSLSIRGEHGRKAMMDWGFAFDSKTENASGKTALPIASRVAPTPIRLFRSPVFFNGARIETRMIEINFGLAAAEVGSTEGTNGRAGMELISIAPTVTIEPLRLDDYINFKRVQTKGPLIAQLGAGILTNGVLNTFAAHMARAEAREVSEVDDNGMTRQRIVFHAVDQVQFAASVASRFFQLARA